MAQVKIGFGSLWFILVLFLLGLAGLSAPAKADEVRPAYLELRAGESHDSDEYTVLWKQPVVENKRLPIDPVFPESCNLEETAPPELTGNALIKRWRAYCDLSTATIEISGLRTSITDVLVRLIKADEAPENYIVRPSDPVLSLGGQGADSIGYLMIGVEHLVGGIDHVLFVIGLVLFVHSPWMLLKTITAFTIAHSITLALSVMNVVSLAQAPVEAVIALSIVFLARELAQPEERRSALTRTSPWLMAFIFGLLHGLGFAGALSEIGLPEDALFTSLLLFNLGIELGQILVVFALVFVLWLWRKVNQGLSLRPDLVHRLAAYTMGSAAMYWTIDRTLILL
ncbi:MAG: HupE/UreJ family protein [Pseudomonadales bacterium]|nr:HupE/UreJ family protein [Pseudomonadales bacterium]